jgi:predicted DsbA family dithiol-disulfide isomerase/uncharacterized membrane protein
MSAPRAALATIVLAAIGLAISGLIASVHHKIAAPSGYQPSFCTVNETVNCDVVLSSSYAYVAGIPVGWWAALAYVLFAVGSVIAMRSKRATRRRQVATALFAAAVGAVGYSLFLACVAFLILRAVCLLCGGLYVVNAGLLVATWLLVTAVRAEGRAGGRQAGGARARTRWIATGAAVAVLTFVVLAWWEGSRNPGALSAEEVAEKYPDFYKWYTSQPIVDAEIPPGHEKGETEAGDSAEVVITEFSDFECHFCAEAYRNLKRVLPRFGAQAQLRFHHFPLDSDCNPSVSRTIHPHACLAAMASECAARQGRFWGYHDLLFENQHALGRDDLVRYADELGLDHAKFLDCLGGDASRRAVDADVREGMRLGVTSTPTFFINGRKVSGALDPDMFAHAIRIERDRAKSKS